VALDNSTAVALTHAHSQMLHRLEPALSKLYAWIDEKQRTDDEDGAPFVSYFAQLQAIKKVILAEADAFALRAQATIAYAQHQAIDLGLSSSHAHLSHIGIAPIRLPSALASLADVADISTPRGKLFGRFGLEAARQVVAIVGRCIHLEQSTRDTAISVGVALKTMLYRAIAIATTAIAAAYRGAVDTLVGNNASEKMLGWYWFSDLQGNTCVACIFMHGSKHPLSEDLGSHPRCHCQKVFYSADTPPMQSGADWLAQQSVEVQKATFDSDALYALYKSGTPLSAFVGHESDPVWGSSIFVKPLKDIKKG
jgi:hypothetical protein